MIATFHGVSVLLDRVFKGACAAAGGSSAIVSPEGTTLFVNPTSPADIATLPQAASLCHRYLKLGDGDVALTNDPFSGGTHLAEFTLVTGLALSGGAIDFLLARRVAFHPRLPDDNTKPARLDDEGVRAPPMPLGSLGNLNRDLLQAISTHPLAPRGLFAEVEGACAELQKTAEILKNIAREPGSILGKRVLEKNLNAYLEDSSRVFDMQMGKLPLGTALVTHAFPSGETIKLQLKITEDRLQFDFAGSESSSRLAMTDLATLGACFASTVSAFDSTVPINSATLQHVQVSAPVRTILSAAPPVGTLQGMLEGVPAVCQLGRKAFARLNANFRESSSAPNFSEAQFLFDDGRLLGFAVPHGTSATPQSPGTPAFSPWLAAPALFNGASDALARWEREFPVRFLSAGVRSASHGNGKNTGGLGASVGVLLEAPCEFKWLEPALGIRHEGLESGRSGGPAQIEIVRNGKREDVSRASGKLRLEAGDRLFMLTSGGGGFGEPTVADTEGA